MKHVIYVLLILAAVSCSTKQVEVFSLVGTTDGLENGTMIYLDWENNSIDSTIIEENSFEFQTKLPEAPTSVVLRTKDYKDYRFLWVDNLSMKFDNSNTDFRNAVVSGSEIENLSFNFSQKLKDLSRGERKEAEMAFVRDNPNSIVSASILSIYSTTWGKEKTTTLFNNFSAKNQQSKYGKKIERYIKLNQNPQVGDRFVDFEMANQFGEVKRLSDLKGKIVLLEFWASWCGPCIAENPNLVKTYEKFNPHGFEIFAVSLDEKKENWIDEITKGNLSWEQVSELNGADNKASLIYGINGIPDNFLINEEGIIVARKLRGNQLDEMLDQILK